MASVPRSPLLGAAGSRDFPQLLEQTLIHRHNDADGFPPLPRSGEEERQEHLVMRRRRPLVFSQLAEVMPDVERLLAGHVMVGRWTLGQVCNHLEMAVRLSMDGMPVKSPWPVRRLFGPLARRLMFRRGRIPEGVRVPALYLPRPGLDAAREAAALRTTMERF